MRTAARERDFEYSPYDIARCLNDGGRIRDLKTGTVWFMLRGVLYAERDGVAMPVPDSIQGFAFGHPMVDDGAEYPLDYFGAMRELTAGAMVERSRYPGSSIYFADGKLWENDGGQVSKFLFFTEEDYTDRWRVLAGYDGRRLR